MFGDHGLCGLLEEGAHEKSPKCLDGNLGDFGEFCKGLNKGFVEKRLGGYKQKGRLKNLSDGLLLLNFVSDCTTEQNRS